jgi:hypothetical protein
MFLAVQFQDKNQRPKQILKSDFTE